jgi:hypothetical protein
MQRIGRELLDRYCRDDRVARLLAAETRPGDDELTIQRWLLQTPAKRLICELLYGDLLDGTGRHILDIGGGLSALTRRLALRHRYELVDLMVHDLPERVAAFRNFLGGTVIHDRDWWECNFLGPFDIVIANDLFPNVDQRLGLFLERLLPIAHEVRLSLTFYNQPRFYAAQRIGAEEILHVLAWDGQQTAAALARFRDRIAVPDFTQFDCMTDSVLANGRQVVVLSLRGDAGDGF